MAIHSKTEFFGSPYPGVHDTPDTVLRKILVIKKEGLPIGSPSFLFLSLKIFFTGNKKRPPVESLEARNI